MLFLLKKKFQTAGGKELNFLEELISWLRTKPEKNIFSSDIFCVITFYDDSWLVVIKYVFKGASDIFDQCSLNCITFQSIICTETYLPTIAPPTSAKARATKRAAA